ncbi:hypothetical protein DVH05_013846 [Phytophthora capsici]|nr:hypothetical protein DVH05_013846 [Phytophthora capsici]
MDASWIPATSVVVDRFFSTVKCTVGYLRKSLSHENREVIMYLKMNWDLVTLTTINKQSLLARLWARKPTNPKRTLAKPQRASVPARAAPAIKDKEARPHFNYTPYSGPLPPLTVESSFAPKGSQNLDHGPRTASPAKTKLASTGRKPRPASVKKAKLQSSTAARETKPPLNQTKTDHP